MTRMTKSKVVQLPSQPNSIGLLKTDQDEVYHIIMGLKSGSAVGSDYISTSIIKKCFPKLVPVIVHVFNLSLSTGVFPTTFKTSIITPVHKSGSRDSAGNYRPISVLTSMSKILEKIINKRLISYFVKFNILSPRQFGFRVGKSTEDAVCELTKFIVHQLDRKYKVIGVFLDLAKAFDTVSIPILVKKLELLGIRHTASRLMESYLSGRMQKTKIGHVISHENSVTYGIPQGSVLGPSLFLAYVNDLCNMELENGKIFSYADDTALIFVGKSWEEAHKYADAGLQRVANWLRDNLLTLNVDKTKIIQFSNSRRKPLKIDLKVHSQCRSSNDCNCPVLENVASIKYLGIIIDKNMSWKPHILSLSKRVRKLIFIFKYLRDVADRNLTFSVYNALCKSILTYCNIAWGGACKTHMKVLERAQRAVLKVATFKHFRFSTEELYKDCEVLTVRQLYIKNLLMAQHKMRLDLEKPNYMFQRRKDRFCMLPSQKTALALHHQSFLGPYLYNKANKHIPKLIELNNRNAKVALDKWLGKLNYDDTEKLIRVVKLG